MIYSLLFLFAQAQASPLFTAEGKICSGPAMDAYGEMITTYEFQARKLADEAAAKRCYPFQVHRQTDYIYIRANGECRSTHPYVVRETVTAQYFCAGGSSAVTQLLGGS